MWVFVIIIVLYLNVDYDWKIDYNGSLGQVENARKHLYFKDFKPDPNEALKLQVIEKHLIKCTDARRVQDWVNALKEADAAIMSGADACAQVKHIVF